MEDRKTRLEIIKEHVDREYHKIQDPFEKRCAFIHSYGVSLCCTMIAAKRGIDIELASIAGLLHDFYLYCLANDPNRVFDDHGRLGAIFVREFLNGLQLMTDEETTMICSAITNHSDKLKVDGDFDEVLKDADMIQKCLYDIEITPHVTYAERYPKLLRELGLQV